MVSPAQIRRLEAVSFRSLPAGSTFYNGTWAIRLTEHHPAKRLNSVTPLDPQDFARLGSRIEDAKSRFSAIGRNLAFRHTPLAPRELEVEFDSQGWNHLEESLVMILNLTHAELDKDINQVPFKDVGQWVDSFLELSNDNTEQKSGLAKVIESTTPECGLFLRSLDGKYVGAVRCVFDNDLAGIFDLVIAEEYRGKAHARYLLTAALKWARVMGAQYAWLQVVADNRAAVNLYTAMGFQELYRYVYRVPPLDY